MTRKAAGALCIAAALTGCGELPPYPCKGQLVEGWVKHLPTGEYRYFDVSNFTEATVRAMDGSKAIYPPICAEYENIEGTPRP